MEQKVDKLIELGCQHSKATLMSLSEHTIDNMLIVQEKQVERAINEQLVEMA